MAAVERQAHAGAGNSHRCGGIARPVKVHCQTPAVEGDLHVAVRLPESDVGIAAARVHGSDLSLTSCRAMVSLVPPALILIAHGILVLIFRLSVKRWPDI